MWENTIWLSQKRIYSTIGGNDGYERNTPKKSQPKHILISSGFKKTNTILKKYLFAFYLTFLHLTLSWRRPISYRNQSIDFLRKSMDWFLYAVGLRHERVKFKYLWWLRLYQVACSKDRFNPLCANFTKWSNTLKQFVGKLPTNCLSVFDHFVRLALKGLINFMLFSFYTTWKHQKIVMNTRVFLFLGTRKETKSGSRVRIKFSRKKAKSWLWKSFIYQNHLKLKVLQYYKQAL